MTFATTPERRAADGRALRGPTPRSAHAELHDAGPARDPVAILEAQNALRVAELVPIRYGRMLASPLAFLRGAAAVMAADLARTPATGLRVQACGDAHLVNFGVFGSPERSLVFDLNDFDETLPAPWEWDVKRLAASVAVAARGNGWRRRKREPVVRAAAEAYRRAVRDFAGRGELEVWYARADVEGIVAGIAADLDRRERRRLRRGVARAYRRDSLSAYRKLVDVSGPAPRIRADPPLVEPMADLLTREELASFLQRIGELVAGYGHSLPPDRRVLLSRLRLVDIARKVVGIGSVGTRSWVALLHGRDRDDPLFLQLKEAQGSVLQPYAGAPPHDDAGRRVVEGQRLMQAVGDILLGHVRVQGIDGARRDFHVRQLRDWKLSLEPEAMRVEAMKDYAGLCGWTLARAHARSGDRIALAAYLGGGEAFDRALVAFAEAYADRTEADLAALREAVRTGRVEAVEGV